MRPIPLNFNTYHDSYANQKERAHSHNRAIAHTTKFHWIIRSKFNKRCLSECNAPLCSSLLYAAKAHQEKSERRARDDVVRSPVAARWLASLIELSLCDDVDVVAALRTLIEALQPNLSVVYVCFTPLNNRPFDIGAHQLSSSVIDLSPPSARRLCRSYGNRKHFMTS